MKRQNSTNSNGQDDYPASSTNTTAIYPLEQSPYNNHTPSHNRRRKLPTTPPTEHSPDDDTKKLQSSRNNHVFLWAWWHHYKNKLSKLSPRQKCTMCTVLIGWKMVQVWLVLRGFVYLGWSGGGAGRGGGEYDLQKYGGGVSLTSDAEMEIRDDHDGLNRVESVEGKRVLYMLTVTCDVDSLQHPSSIQQRLQQKHSDKLNKEMNANQNNAKINIQETNMNTLLANLATNIESIIHHPNGIYTVDVYWIMSCTWSNYSHDAIQIEDVNDWNEYIMERLPMGVGVEIWEDALPLEYDGGEVVEKGGVRGSTSLVSDEPSGMQVKGSGERRLTEELMVQSKSAIVELKESTVGRKSAQRRKSEKEASINTRSIKGDKQRRAMTLSPSIHKFLKQHRYVVRDKLDNYDVFLSFGATLHHQHSPLATETTDTERVVQIVNGTRMEFCTQTLYQNSDITCGKRVKNLVKHHHISENDAMIALLKETNCICTAVNMQDETSIRALERITGDHIDAYVSLSLELEELLREELVLPGLLSVDVHSSPAAAANVNAKSTLNDGEEQYDIDSSPCCADVILDDSIKMAVDMKGGGKAMNVNDWQIIKGEAIDLSDVDVLENEDGTIPFSEWIAIEPVKNGRGIKFFQDGWILTKEQLLRLDSGNNRGKFLPPFREDNAPFRNNGPGLASPLFEAEEKGGLGIRRAISLDPQLISGQLIHPLRLGSRSSTVSENTSLGVDELLLHFNKAKEIDQKQS